MAHTAKAEGITGTAVWQRGLRCLVCFQELDVEGEGLGQWREQYKSVSQNPLQWLPSILQGKGNKDGQLPTNGAGAAGGGEVMGTDR